MVERFPLMFLLVSHLFVSGVMSRNFTIENKCDYTVWPGILTMAVMASPSTTGFSLKKGESRVINMPSSWTGRLWGRSHCSTSSTGNFSCATGDCGTGKIECSGEGASSPTTLIDFTLDGPNGEDYYDVTVANGYNLPLVVVPQLSGSGRTCSNVGCVVNLNKTCPSELRVMGRSNKQQPIACMNACDKFGLPEFCCYGEHSTPETCQPTLYSKNFKNECPLAYSYAYDDRNSTVRCSNSANYILTFCPLITSNTTNNTISSASQSSKETNGGTKQKSSWKLKLILGVSAAALTMMITIFVVIILRTKNERKSDWDEQNVEAVIMLKRYSYTRVKKMTNSFAHVLGKGGFGTVYKGKLPNSGRDIAVKILKETEGNGEEFINEVASMSRTSHVNIVSLLGFCYERNKRAIIYEFMPNGSLDKFVYENMSTKKDWEKLYDIAIGVSRGLEYLHNRCVSRIVHFDIKPQNILMDENLCPKISDFGLAKLCKNKESIISMLHMRGTFGYISPEMFSKNFGAVSHKSDVYSFGMVILEMIGAKNIERVKYSGSNNSSMYFPEWVYKDFEKGETTRIFGDGMTDEEENIAKKLVLVALWCIQMNPSDRPPMIKVIEMLEGNLEAIEVPPNPYLLSLPAPVPESLENSNETSTFFNPSHSERGTRLSSDEDALHFSEEVFQQTIEESQHGSRSS
ncbi:PREDICTED: LEAF RUST 10 DISEASE-RESISTANCE LOCUS RECEPTOR-LIKE PROTEIN KINASE-like 2.2 [Camelina sativa]|uniref:LEAF RUST 10 DISEASE-RESISTANCE LOCUS RECEPTOR-LIKE PROTEIN KINASE-like 2.2 n=1 Tax=Camelina sativa TaxID=90675 RepID=A0ABM0U4L0_CAMSA|nr:PREDICTED: LEAF RUST 10 DISEASE-RESISTANCE LOCUS RECEPTOR-LIKE PROTEIN KINASE-like 2.2 [Camelina sativa]